MDEILDWIFADARREFLVQSIFCVGGVLTVVYGLILQIKSKLRHEVLPRELAVESDCRALRIFAAVIFGMEILLLCWGMSSSQRYDLGLLFAACIAWLTFAGSVIAVRSRSWGYVLLLLAEFFLGAVLIPACSATLGV